MPWRVSFRQSAVPLSSLPSSLKSRRVQSLHVHYRQLSQDHVALWKSSTRTNASVDMELTTPTSTATHIHHPPSLLIPQRDRRTRACVYAESRKHPKASNYPARPPLVILEREKKRRTAYQFFVKKNFQNVHMAGEHTGQTIRRLGRLWKQLAEVERKKYHEMVVQSCTETVHKLRRLPRMVRSNIVMPTSILRLTPYNLFIRDRSKDNKQVFVGNAMRELGAEWRSNRNNVREKYTQIHHQKILELHVAAKQRFNPVQYRSQQPTLIRPKRSLFAYQLFLREQFQQLQLQRKREQEQHETIATAATEKTDEQPVEPRKYTKIMVQLSQETARRWRAMSEHEKEPYRQQETQLRHIYHQQRAAYEQSASITDQLLALDQKMLSNLRPRVYNSIKRRRNAKSAFRVFMKQRFQELRVEVPGMRLGTAMPVIAREWNEMDDHVRRLTYAPKVI